METVKDATKSSHMDSSGKMGGEEREEAFRGSEMDGGQIFVKTKIEK